MLYHDYQVKMINDLFLLLDPGISITALNKTACDAFGEQVCLIRVTPGRKITFQISVSGDYQPYMISWYKFYSAQGPQFHG